MVHYFSGHTNHGQVSHLRRITDPGIPGFVDITLNKDRQSEYFYTGQSCKKKNNYWLVYQVNHQRIPPQKCQRLHEN